MESWANLSTLVVENCPNVDFLSIADSVLSSTNALKYARCTNIDATKADFNILNKLSRIKGIGDNNEYTETAYLSGKYVVLKAIKEDIERMKSLYPYLSISARTTLETIFVTFEVTSQYGVIKGATVEINNSIYDLSSGTVKVPLAKGERYDYVIRYSGGKDTGYITPSSDTTISKSYEIEFDIMTLKPEPNGKMQVLLTGNSVSISIDTGPSVNIDWGDGSTSNEGSHTYTDGNAFHNVSVDSVEEENTEVLFSEGSIVAFWTVGNTMIGPDSLKKQEKLEYVSKDVCFNTNDVSSFFYYCGKLKEIPKSVFISNGDTDRLSEYNGYGIFERCYSLKSIPAGLFDAFKNVIYANAAFSECGTIESIPRGLFDKMEKLKKIDEDSYYYSNYRGIFTRCSSLKEVPFDIFDKNPIENFDGTFAETKLTVGLLPVSLKNPAARHNYVYYSCPIEKIIGRTETPATINSNCIPSSVLKIYVPDSAIETYKTATNWSAHKDKIVGWSELTDEERQKYGLTI